MYLLFHEYFHLHTQDVLCPQIIEFEHRYSGLRLYMITRQEVRSCACKPKTFVIVENTASRPPVRFLQLFSNVPWHEPHSRLATFTNPIRRNILFAGYSYARRE